MKRNDSQAPRVDEGFTGAAFGFYKLFWIFIIGCVAGVIIENLYCLVTANHFENRSGVLYGPFNPVYGFGAVLMTMCLSKLDTRKVLMVFVSSAVLGALFEFICSYWQETVLGTISWQYTNEALNLSGRTSLKYAFFWGVLGVVWIRNIAPFLSRQIDRIPKHIGMPLTWILAIFMAFNMGISSLAVWRQVRRHQGIAPQSAVECFLDEHYTDDVLKKVYPNMIIVGQGPERKYDFD